MAAPQPLDRRGDRRRLDSGDDAVALPPREHLERRHPAAMLGQQDRPRLVLAEMPVDPFEQSTAVGVRCLDQDGNSRTRGHGGAT
jgi:hypothetical protein